jgi:NTP-dependent ternary system trypsin peptidase co-occuring protein
VTPAEPEPQRLGLSAALEGLRDELEDAWRSSQGRRVRFRATDVTLTVETVLSRDKDGSGRIRWWLIEAGGGVKSGEQVTQTLVLKLTPGLYGDNDEDPAPLDVGDEQEGPGG